MGSAAAAALQQLPDKKTNYNNETNLEFGAR